MLTDNEWEEESCLPFSKQKERSGAIAQLSLPVWMNSAKLKPVFLSVSLSLQRQIVSAASWDRYFQMEPYM